MIEIEEDYQTAQGKLGEKDKLIAKLEKKVATLEHGLKSGDMKTLENLDGMADLEAKLAFATNDKNEAQEELEFVRRSNSSQISELKN